MHLLIFFLVSDWLFFCGDGGGDDCEFFDCEGQEACGYENWVGDGVCDDGTWGIYYNCEEFNNDEGDCDDDGGDSLSLIHISEPTRPY